MQTSIIQFSPFFFNSLLWRCVPRTALNDVPGLTTYNQVTTITNVITTHYAPSTIVTGVHNRVGETMVSHQGIQTVEQRIVPQTIEGKFFCHFWSRRKNALSLSRACHLINVVVTISLPCRYGNKLPQTDCSWLQLQQQGIPLIPLPFIGIVWKLKEKVGSCSFSVQQTYSVPKIQLQNRIVELQSHVGGSKPAKIAFAPLLLPLATKSQLKGTTGNENEATYHVNMTGSPEIRSNIRKENTKSKVGKSRSLLRSKNILKKTLLAKQNSFIKDRYGNFTRSEYDLLSWILRRGEVARSPKGAFQWIANFFERF